MRRQGSTPGDRFTKGAPAPGGVRFSPKTPSFNKGSGGQAYVPNSPHLPHNTGRLPGTGPSPAMTKTPANAIRPTSGIGRAVDTSPSKSPAHGVPMQRAGTQPARPTRYQNERQALQRASDASRALTRTQRGNRRRKA